MYLDVTHLKEFYDLPLGRMLRVLVGSRVKMLWPEMRGQSLLGIGYAAPYLRPYLKKTNRVFAGMPAAQGVVKWPREVETPNKAFLMEAGQLPLPDSCIDRILLVHALEMAGEPGAMLEEVYRVLAPGGRVMVIVPNRRGAWARSEVSPFGYGRPYSRPQLDNFLNNHHLSVISREEALFVPPTNSKLVLKNARSFERLGAVAWSAFAGVLVTEAEKQIYRGIPQRASKVARVLRPVFLPDGKPAGAQVRTNHE
ncbi:methyltransferase domain-containing protein [Pseudovibrio sp. Tun.PSC04-5.I4]|uniref:class I SAM-dependent methyltransferase n=1 Tax=Pseudovibrio sp. Tun.PSC04-5.I4 TaxID=1798213 RepID=UPI00088A06E3|nr:methyltransferase domain-containing protein [Pseudovibrio sp. Tun.PSC04-5.I4]SDR28020.1 Methyltransferase domain-containing protein [Pseudovibrio sp. Tun.PSC04-5.I4]